MKRVLLVGLSIFLMLTFFPNTTMIAAENPPQAEVETAQPPFDFTQVIKVGYYGEVTDFADDMDSLNSKGYGVDIFHKIQEVSDLEFEYIELSADPTTALQSGEVDLLAFCTQSQEQAQELLFSQIPYGKTYVSLMTEDMDFVYGDFPEMDGKTVATFVDNIGNERLDFISEHLDFEIEYIYGQAHNYMDLDADFYLAFSGSRHIESLNNILDVGVYNLYLNSTFENRELIEKLDAILYDIVVTEGNFFLELEEKYLADNVEITHRGMMPDEIEILQERPLEVGYIADYAPICYMNEQGEPSGAMIDTLNYYADLYDFEVNYHPYSLSDSPEDYDHFDILVTIYGNATNDREHYSVTEPYYLMPLYAQINLDRVQTIVLEEILSTSPKIGVLPYQTVDFGSFTEVFPGTELVMYNDWFELLDDFEAGKIDMMMSTASAATYAELYLDDMNRTTIHTDTSVPMQYFINKDIAEQYLPIFNVMIDRMSQSEYEAILQVNANEFLPSGDVSFMEFLAGNWYYFALIILTIVAVFVFIYANVQIKNKQALLESYNTEPLTGFMAPQYFRDNMEELLKTAKPNEYELIVFDMDMFKNINTYFSTDKGTEVILSIADALKTAFAGTNALISRRTAEQFLIFRRVNAGGTLQHICDHFIMPAIKSNIVSRYNVYMSFGNVIVDDPKEKITTIIGQAYAARMIGKNIHKTTFVTFDADMKKQYENKAAITFRMDQALKDEEFFVEYQPKVDFNSLKIDGAEALVRWQPNNGDKIFPDSFIPIFEENGFIPYLDLYVIEEVCKFIQSNSRVMNIPRISVNLSAHTILSDNILQSICQHLSTYNLSPDAIELELTESAVEANADKFLEVVQQFKKHGFVISIDDFGAGVSSLNRLSTVEADILKLDKAFFSLKEQGSRSSSVVSDVISMAKHLNMKVVAEGVETHEQALWLKGIGCDYAQGYYFARPMGGENFKKLLTAPPQYSLSQ